MPKVGMEAVRRASLVEAAIAEIGEAGSLGVTVSQIARRAGVSSALAHHYFGSKDQIFLAAMRKIMGEYGSAVRAELRRAETPRGRVEAIIRGSFDPSCFEPAVVSAWLNFYVLAQSSDDVHRLLTVYHRRLHSNLLTGLRPLVGDCAEEVAQTIAALIDGQYIRQGLKKPRTDRASAIKSISGYLDSLFGRAS